MAFLLSKIAFLYTVNTRVSSISPNLFRHHGLHIIATHIGDWFSRICGVDLFEKIKSMVFLVKISANMNFIHGNLCRWTVFAKSCINECFIWNVNTSESESFYTMWHHARDTVDFLGHLGGMAQLHWLDYASSGLLCVYCNEQVNLSYVKRDYCAGWYKSSSTNHPA